jgi:hypothetical protein
MSILKNTVVATLLLCSTIAFPAVGATELHLSKAEATSVGKKIWRNECGGTVAGLTSWNAGEEFPSLGIGHFIWYPKDFRGPFDESFPRLLAYFQEQHVKLPEWLKPGMPSPWSTKQEFDRDINSPRMQELRNLLSSTVPVQTQFIVRRLEAALPKMVAAAPAECKEKLPRQFNRMLKGGPRAVFALVDYVNFKGEGVLESERYNGYGWGLLQVLCDMQNTKDTVHDFAESAKKALSRRVANAPAARHEDRWLSGWNKRIDRYISD